MKKVYIFKGGFEIGEEEKNFFAYQLTVCTKDIESTQAYRLAQAVDKEYKELLKEQCGIKEGGIEQWLGKVSE